MKVSKANIALATHKVWGGLVWKNSRPPPFKIIMKKHKGKKLKKDDSFFLYDLKIEVIKGEKRMVCNHGPGDHVILSGENLSIPSGQTFSIYALAALIPLLPAKQRETQRNDWMSTDNEIACPDPNCGAKFKITRIKKRIFKHSETTATPLE